MKPGARAVVNQNKEDPAETVRSITGRAPEIVFECIGVKSTLGAAIGMAGRRGRVVVLGGCMEPDRLNPTTCIMKEGSIGSPLGHNRPPFPHSTTPPAPAAISPTPLLTTQ